MKKRSVNLTGGSKPRYSEVFLIAAAACAVIFFFVLIFSGGHSMSGLLSSDTKGTFMDFFNGLVSSKGDPYGSGSLNTPFSVFVNRMLYQFVPKDVAAKVLSNSSSQSVTPNVKMSQYFYFPFILCAVTAFVLLFFALKAIKDGNEFQRYAFVALTMMSAPLLFAYERGSGVVFVLILLVFFAAAKDSGRTVPRLLAVIALSVAGALAFPALLFTILLFREKRVRYGVWVFILWACLTVTSLILLCGGISGAAQWCANVASRASYEQLVFDGQLNFARALTYPLSFTGLSNEVLVNIGKIFGLGVGILTLFGAVVAKKEWQRAALVCALIYGLAPVCETTLLALFVIPLAMLMNTEDKNRPLPYVSLVLLTATQVLTVSYDFTAHAFTRLFSTKLTSYSVLALALLLSLWAAADLVSSVKSKKAVKSGQTPQKEETV